MDESLGNSSMDSIEVGPTSPRVLVTPRIPAAVMMRETPLSTKRERQAMTPRYRGPMPKIFKSQQPQRSILSMTRKDTTPQLLTPHGPQPLESPLYDHKNTQSFLEQTFKIDEIIGRGSFGEVFAARCLEDSRLYAVKVSIAPIRQHSISKYREAELHMLIPPHKNLVRFYRAWVETDRLYIQTELCEQSLQQYCLIKHALPEKEIWNISVDLLQAVHHLHSLDMIHDDIKPDNIFLTRHKICKLGDFGLVINLKNPNDVKSAEEGDSKYLAPEVLNGRPTKASDIFSLGVTILEAATDLDVPSSGDAWHQIRNGQIPPRFFVGISPILQDLIKSMLDKDPLKRPTSQTLLAHASMKRKIFLRGLYVKWVDTSDSLTSLFKWILVWCMAFVSVVFRPVAWFHEEIQNRRSEICAQFLNPHQQHTPIHTPENSKAYSESLTGVALRQAVPSPFDFSDDENPPHSQRRLFQSAPVPPFPSRLNFDDDDDEDEEQATCSSSNSSAIEPIGDVSPRFRRPVTSMVQRESTPKSARRLLSAYRPSPGLSPTTSNFHNPSFSHQDHQASGDGFNNNMSMLTDQERTEKYRRMQQTEQHRDWIDRANVVDEAPPPMSCPPRIRRGTRDLPRLPLNFNLLDDEPAKKEGGDDVEQKREDKKAAPEMRRFLRSNSKQLRSRTISFQGSSGDEC
ncbi:unnamed protein product [Caenorhabditis brenneri]